MHRGQEDYSSAALVYTKCMIYLTKYSQTWIYFYKDNGSHIITLTDTVS